MSAIYKSKTSHLMVKVHEITEDYVLWEGFIDFPMWGCHRTAKNIFMQAMEEV